MSRMNNSRSLLNSGITLIEVMLICMILIIISAVIFAFLPERKDSPATIKERTDLLTLKNAFDFYKLDNGFYPTNEQGINALIQKPTTAPIPANWIQYMKKAPHDAWGRAYQYNNKGNTIAIYRCEPPLEEQNWWFKLTHLFTFKSDCYQDD